MKAPISKKTLAILSDKTGAKKLVQSVIVKDTAMGTRIKIGGRQYELQRVTSYDHH